MPGNLGYWDMALAFKFIYENIRYFNGDAKRITAWGQSAGAASVGSLVVSPHTRGNRNVLKKF